jgi:hypothetical protein
MRIAKSPAFTAALLFLISLILLSTLSITTEAGWNDISVSDTHGPTFVNSFTRFYVNQDIFTILRNASAPTINLSRHNPATYNVTINYTKVPKVLQGSQQKIIRPLDVQNDVLIHIGKIRFDPRTCPNDVAYCYQLRQHPQNETPILTPGRNYTSTSTYVLPPVRVKQYVCIGSDLECVDRSTGCSCPTERVPPPPNIWGSQGSCSDISHLCMNSYGSFVICTGNLTDCRAKYDACGCGRRAACVSTQNTCVNERDELTLCAGTMSDCLTKFKTCFCGPDMLVFQKGCTTRTHTCMKDNRTSVCSGTLAQCALNFDRCEC